MNGITCRVPEGAFYVFPSCKGVIGKVDGRITKLQMMKNYDIIIRACRSCCCSRFSFWFGGYFRISYATSDENLKNACVRMRDFLIN